MLPKNQSFPVKCSRQLWCIDYHCCSTSNYSRWGNTILMICYSSKIVADKMAILIYENIPVVGRQKWFSKWFTIMRVKMKSDSEINRALWILLGGQSWLMKALKIFSSRIRKSLLLNYFSLYISEIGAFVFLILQMR